MAFNLKLFTTSFGRAVKGWQKTFFEQQNFKIQLLVAVLVLALALVLKIKLIELALLILLITLVLVLELINTAFEYVVDILKPRIHIYAEKIKDILAGAVLLASLAAIIVGLIIFLPYLVKF